MESVFLRQRVPEWEEQAFAQPQAAGEGLVSPP